MKEINYKQTNQDILKRLNTFKTLLEEFDKFELAEHIKDEIEAIREEVNFTLNIKDYNKQSFNKIIEAVCQIEDNLSEISMVSGDLIKDLNKLPEDRKKAIYYHLGIKEITFEYERLSEKLESLLDEMFAIIKKILDKYLGYCDEE